MGCNQTTANDIDEAERADRDRKPQQSSMSKPPTPIKVTATTARPPVAPHAEPQKDVPEVSYSVGIKKPGDFNLKTAELQSTSWTEKRDFDNEELRHDLCLRKEREIIQTAQQNMFDLSQMEEPLGEDELEERYSYYSQYTAGVDKGLGNALPKSLTRAMPQSPISQPDSTLLNNSALKLLSAFTQMAVKSQEPFITSFTPIDPSMFEK